MSYPHPYRLIDVDTKKGTLTVRSERVVELTSMKGSAETLRHKSESYANSALSGVLESMLPKSVPSDVKNECAQVLGEAYAMHLAGDERPSESFQENLKAATKRLRHYSWKWAFILKRIGKHLSTDTGVADNDVTVSYR